jgi:LysR family transcriptional regulator, transcriptional activator of the cysJI operon
MAQLENFRLKVFRVVAEHLSFHKAAEDLFLTQPAVTRQIKALENDLGVRLFDRTTSKIVLTRQGSVLLGYARKLAQVVSEAERELIADDGQPSGELCLGASTTIAQYVLPCLLRIFLKENPRVQVSLQSGNTSEIVRLLLDNKVSLGLIEDPTRARGIHTERFVEDELVLITPLNFEFERVSSSELVGLTLLLREHGSGSRRAVESALEKGGLKLKSFTKIMKLDSTEAIKSAVEVGLGVAFVSRWAITNELELGLLKITSVDGIRVTRHFSLISRTGPEPQGLVDAFRVFTLKRAAHISKVRKKTIPTI